MERKVSKRKKKKREAGNVQQNGNRKSLLFLPARFAWLLPFQLAFTSLIYWREKGCNNGNKQHPCRSSVAPTLFCFCASFAARLGYLDMNLVTRITKPVL